MFTSWLYDEKSRSACERGAGSLQGATYHATGRGTPIPEEIAANVADAVAVYPDLEGIEIDAADTDHLEADSIDAYGCSPEMTHQARMAYA